MVFFSFLKDKRFILNKEYSKKYSFSFYSSYKILNDHNKLKIHLHNSNTRPSKLHMFIAERFYNINCSKILPYKLPQYTIAFPMKDP